MLRPYRIDGLDLIRSEFKRTKKVLLKMPTGAGKTVIFCEMLKGVYAKGNYATMVVRGRKLVDQASRRLFRENVPHGVRMANHWNYKPQQRIQVCSIDTLLARGIRPKANLVVVDEAHLFTSDTSVEFFNSYKDSYILGVTATPYCDRSLRHIADTIVEPISMIELIEQGWLVPPRYFVPSLPDLTGVRTQAGDYVKNQLNNVMMDATLVGDIVTHWRKYGRQGRRIRPTLVFATSIQHSKEIVRQFNAQGIAGEHCDADTSDAERENIVRRLTEGKTAVVSNVGIFGIGVDIPPVSCLVLARPTKSEILYVQQTGRGTRPARGKNDFILLDHAGNCLRHGFIEDERDSNIDGREKTKPTPSISPKICQECFAAFRGATCPTCGADTATKRPRSFEVMDGNLSEIKALSQNEKIEKYIGELRKTAKKHNYRRGWVFWRLVDRYGEEVAKKFQPEPEIPNWVRRKCATTHG